MKTAVIIDDKDHALKQIQHEFPKDKLSNWDFIHFDSVEHFRKQSFKQIDIVFLDFFLCNDRIYGLDVLPELKSEYLVCFSSKIEMSNAMANDAVLKGFFESRNVYSVQKLKESLENPRLRETLTEITDRLSKTVNKSV